MAKLIVRRCPTCDTEGRRIAAYREPNPSLYDISDLPVPLRACASCGLEFFDLLEGVNSHGEIYGRMPLSSSVPKRRHEILSMLINRLKRKSLGLELGAGACHVGQLLSATRHRVIALDRYDRHSATKDHITYLNADCSRLKGDLFEEEMFDWVIVDNVLEHLPCYRSTLAHCIRWLKQDGLAIVCVPNTKTMAQYLSRRHRARVYRPIEHVNNFTEPSLTFLFADLGCQRIRCHFPVRSLFDAGMWSSINFSAPFGIYKLFKKAYSRT